MQLEEWTNARLRSAISSLARAGVPRSQLARIRVSIHRFLISRDSIAYIHRWFRTIHVRRCWVEEEFQKDNKKEVEFVLRHEITHVLLNDKKLFRAIVAPPASSIAFYMPTALTSSSIKEEVFADAVGRLQKRAVAQLVKEIRQ